MLHLRQSRGLYTKTRRLGTLLAVTAIILMSLLNSMDFSLHKDEFSTTTIAVEYKSATAGIFSPAHLAAVGPRPPRVLSFSALLPLLTSFPFPQCRFPPQICLVCLP